MRSIVFYYAFYFVVGNFYHPVDREIYYRSPRWGHYCGGAHNIINVEQNHCKTCLTNAFLEFSFAPSRLVSRRLRCCFTFFILVFWFYSNRSDCIYLGISFDTQHLIIINGREMRCVYLVPFVEKINKRRCMNGWMRASVLWAVWLCQCQCTTAGCCGV